MYDMDDLRGHGEHAVLKYLPPMTTCIHNCCSVTYNEKLYVIGGMSREDVLTMCMVFDKRTNQWYDFSALITPRAKHSVCVHQGRLYAAGGYASKYSSVGLSTVESCDLSACDQPSYQWINTCKMSCERYSFGLVSHGTYLYAIGGSHGDNFSVQTVLSSVERYDKGSNSWTFVASMNREREDAGAVAWGPYIYVFGGVEGEEMTSAERYDPALDRWSYVCKMTYNLKNINAVAIGNYIYVLGKLGNSCTCERYDPVQDVYTRINSVEFFDECSVCVW